MSSPSRRTRRVVMPASIAILVGALTLMAAAPVAAQWSDATTGDLGSTMPTRGVSWIDFDGDGDLDLYLAVNGSNLLLRNDGEDPGSPGDWIFTNVAPAGTGIGDDDRGSVGVWADFDDDGDLDVYVANDVGPNHLFRNDPLDPGDPGDLDRVFVEVTGGPLTTTRSTQSAAWVDFDLDGDPDLYLANRTGNMLLRNDGPDPFDPGAWIFVDAAPGDGGGVGDAASTQAAVWGDFDGDGDPDLYLANDGVANRLFRNDPVDPGDPRDHRRVFVEIAAGGPLAEAGMGRGAAWADYDNDGDLDLYLVNYGAANKLFRNDGADGGSPGGWAFVEVGAAAGVADGGNGRGLAWADYDNDTWPDLYLVNSDDGINTADNRLYRNLGDGTFADSTTVLLADDASYSATAAWGDFDADGDLDVYLGNWNAESPNRLFRNDDPGTNGWIHVGLEGLNSDSWGLGARLRVVHGDTVQVREVTAGEGLMSQGSPEAEFGLGLSALVDTLEVRWPSGVVQTVTGLAPRQFTLLVEPGLAAPTMTAEPVFTAGDSNTVTWSDETAAGAVDYEVQLADDSGFTNLLADSGWITATSHVFTGLADGLTGWYRVRARDAGLAVSGWSAPVGSVQDDADPESSVLAVADPQPGYPFAVDYSATDNGSGVVSVELWYRFDGLDPYVLYASRDDGEPFVFSIPQGPGLYEFYSLAADAVGRVEAAPVSADMSVTVLSPPWVNVAPTDGSGVGNAGNGRGAAWADYDGDGRHDLYITNRPVWQTGADPTDHLFHNDGPDLGDPEAWLFTDATAAPMGDGAYGQGVAWGDYDGDGDLDLYAGVMQVSPGTPAPNHLYRNDGGGAFTDVAAASGVADPGSARSVNWIDFDLDGDLDVYLANDGANRLYRNDGEDPGAPGVWLFVDAAASDTNGVGDNQYTMGSAWGDYDNDGDPDLYLANYLDGVNRLLRNDGVDPGDPARIVFTDVAPALGLDDAGWGVGTAWGDYDNDGRLDLYLANRGENHLFHQTAGGVFVDVTAESGAGLDDDQYSTGVAWADYDNDGDLDLYLGNHWPDAGPEYAANRFFRNDGEDPGAPGTWVFVDVAPATGVSVADTSSTCSVTFVDHDDDGDLDLYLVSMTAGANKLFRNDAAGGNHWLHLDLSSPQPNTAAIGARVRVVAGGVSQIRDVDGGSGFLSQGSLTVEFGLGAATAADSVIIDWPSGATQVLLAVPADQRLPVSEDGLVTPIMAAEPAFTAGVENTVAWSDVSASGAVEYEVQRAGEPAFSVLLATSGWIAGTQHVFGGMADGDLGYYRVRARDADSLATIWSPSVMSRQDALPPVSAVDSLGAQIYQSEFPVTVTAFDSVSGVAEVRLFYRHEDDPGFTLFGALPRDEAFAFDSPDGLGVYELYSVAVDSVGYEESAPAGYDRQVEVLPPLWADIAPEDGSGVANEGNGRGVAWGDYDADGRPDLFLTNQPDLQTVADAVDHLFRNDGPDGGDPDGWLFGDATAPPLDDDLYGQGAAWGDFDGDGDLDLYKANMQISQGYYAPNRLYRNQGNGTFTDIAVSAGVVDGGDGRGVAWADFDQDGDLDLYLANHGANRLYRNDGENPGLPGQWVFTNVAPADGSGIGDGQATMSAAWADFDNDGDQDLYTVDDDGGVNRLFRNDGEDPGQPGDWIFTEVAASLGVADAGDGAGAAWGDFDEDGWVDLYVTNDGANRLYRNLGASVGAGGAPLFQEVAAVCGDGLADAGNGTGVAWADYDNDGDLDLYLGNAWPEGGGTTAANRLFRNDGPLVGPPGGRFFTDVAAEGGGLLADTGSAGGLAWADHDDDGDLDLYLANTEGGRNRLFRNDVAGGNHWLHLDLTSVRANTAAIGARVRVLAGGVIRCRYVDGGSGFLSQGSLTVEFGLGAATTVDAVEILWPTGYLQYLYGVAVDQRLAVLGDDPTDVGPGLPDAAPKVLALHQNFPNPFNPSTTIRFELPVDARVRLDVFRLDGGRVARLADAVMPAGRHGIVWRGLDDRGAPVASGVYFYRLETGDARMVRRMTLLR